MRQTGRLVQDSPERDWRALRQARGMSLRHVAGLTGINPGILSHIENRERRVTPEWAAALVRVYGEPGTAPGK